MCPYCRADVRNNLDNQEHIALDEEADGVQPNSGANFSWGNFFSANL